ncbi:unnamed protein product [Linum tenue]|uniref:Uncharacterized protein n=1 Tax=Linum tenue TaxID=586396 RepID=A0AAV0QYJ7_9ROSI|nr:unnamed protein product [Linum tenue]
MELLKEYKGKLAKVAGSNSPPRQFYVYALCGFVRAQHDIAGLLSCPEVRFAKSQIKCSKGGMANQRYVK